MFGDVGEFFFLQLQVFDQQWFIVYLYFQLVVEGVVVEGFVNYWVVKVEQISGQQFVGGVKMKGSKQLGICFGKEDGILWELFQGCLWGKG